MDSILRIPLSLKRTPSIFRIHNIVAFLESCIKITSASGLVVKSNVAIVGPPVRFRACASFLLYILFFFFFLFPKFFHEKFGGTVHKNRRDSL